jgi:hypothetical protein
VSLTSIIFTNNVIERVGGFPNLRHNVYVANGSNITVSDLNPDTGSSNFIYVVDDGIDGGSVVNGVGAPLFEPKVTSVSPSKLSEGDTTQFVFSGSSFYPCGLGLRLYKDKGGQEDQIIVCCDFFFF